MKKFLILGVVLTGLTALTAQEAAKPADASAAAPAAGAADTAKVMLGTLPAVMKFDKTEFTVKPGQKVMILFKNDKCPLQHNILIGKPGTKDKIGAEADKMLADPTALAKHYFPASADVLFKGTKLIGIGQSDLIEFTAPTDEGDYPYVCTFPGHWRTMNGVMKVVK